MTLKSMLDSTLRGFCRHLRKGCEETSILSRVNMHPSSPILSSRFRAALLLGVVVSTGWSCGDRTTSGPAAVTGVEVRSHASSIPDAASHTWSVVSESRNGAGAVNVGGAAVYPRPAWVRVVVSGLVTRTPNYPFIGGPVTFGPAGNSVLAWGDGINNHAVILNGSGGSSGSTITDYVFFFGQGIVHSVSRAGYQTRSIPGVVGNPPVYCGERIWHPPCDTFSGTTTFSLTPLQSELSLQADSTNVEPGSTVTFTHAASPQVVEGKSMPLVVDSSHWIPDDPTQGMAEHRPGLGACHQLNPCRRSIAHSGTFSMSAWVNGKRYEKSVHVDAQTDELVVELIPSETNFKPVLDRIFDANTQTWSDPDQPARLADLVDLQVIARWEPSGRPAAGASVELTVESVSGSGFHPHTNPPRPKGTFFTPADRPRPGSQQKGVLRPQLTQVTDAAGKSAATYRTSGVSGVEIVQVRVSAEGRTATKTATVTIQWPDLIAMARFGPHWEYSPQGHTIHGDVNHWGEADFMKDVKELFEAYFAETMAPRFVGESRFVINEFSLQWGGLFDHSTPWKNPHRLHRKGQDMDVRSRSLSAAQRVTFENLCRETERNLVCTLETNPEHYHLRRP